MSEYSLINSGRVAASSVAGRRGRRGSDGPARVTPSGGGPTSASVANAIVRSGDRQSHTRKRAAQPKRANSASRSGASQAAVALRSLVKSSGTTGFSDVESAAHGSRARAATIGAWYAIGSATITSGPSSRTAPATPADSPATPPSPQAR